MCLQLISLVDLIRKLFGKFTIIGMYSIYSIIASHLFLLHFLACIAFRSLCFSVNYLGGDGKGPEHLALQPMYVDSNSAFNIYNTARSKSSGSDVSDAILHKPIYQHYRFNKNSKARGSAAYTDLIRYNTHSKSDERLNHSLQSDRMYRPKSLYANVFAD